MRDIRTYILEEQHVLFMNIKDILALRILLPLKPAGRGGGKSKKKKEKQTRKTCDCFLWNLS